MNHETRAFLLSGLSREQRDDIAAHAIKEWQNRNTSNAPACQRATDKACKRAIAPRFEESRKRRRERVNA